MKKNGVKAKWNEVKDEVTKVWSKVTDDELEKTKGDLGQVTELIQKKYGETKESIRERLKSFVKNIKTNNKNEQPKLHNEKVVR